jgi:hypothetical protein
MNTYYWNKMGDSLYLVFYKQMAEPVSPKMAQYESSNEGSGNGGSSPSYETPSPPYPLYGKGQQKAVTEDNDPDYIPEQLVYNH